MLRAQHALKQSIGKLTPQNVIKLCLSVFVSRLVLVIGYGSDQATPRLEILYNGWLVLVTLAIGLLIASFILGINHGRMHLPAVSAITILLILFIPTVSIRLQTE